MEHHANTLRQDFLNLKAIVTSKDKRIRCLEQKVNVLEAEADRREQYSRRPNLLFQGIPEADRESTNDLVLSLINEKMGLTGIGLMRSERSHRLGPKHDKQGRSRKCPIIVPFRSEAIRDEVFRAQAQLKQ